MFTMTCYDGVQCLQLFQRPPNLDFLQLKPQLKCLVKKFLNGRDVLFVHLLEVGIIVYTILPAGYDSLRTSAMAMPITRSWIVPFPAPFCPNLSRLPHYVYIVG